MNLSNAARRAVVLITMDVLIVVELTYAFSKCFSGTGDFSETFLKAYVPLFAPTIIGAFILLGRIKRRERREAAAAEAAAETRMAADA
ncbi:hypothetical protein [Solidesulfovibrio alcoholivorans]|uniref:hypothetical protein n=1 Tax=Solidesulfovibrio alcoholivorans TaxID=81406 RepID=UPI00049701AD|nr:hypothetical protein [Solidesulfovibrio alcoholivorans]